MCSNGQRHSRPGGRDLRPSTPYKGKPVVHVDFNVVICTSTANVKANLGITSKMSKYFCGSLRIGISNGGHSGGLDEAGILI